MYTNEPEGGFMEELLFELNLKELFRVICSRDGFCLIEEGDIEEEDWSKSCTYKETGW